jgi:DNA-binding NarL/FixJ family response regulator
MSRLLIAEPHLLMRKGLAALLSQIGPYAIVDEVGGGADAVRRTHELAPDLLVVAADIGAPALDGVVGAVKRQRAAQRILVVADEDGIGSARDALRAGCEGFVRKQSSPQQFAAALTEVLAGRAYVDHEVARRTLIDASATEDPAEAALAPLSRRERSVFQLIAQGHTNRSAGDTLNISPKTVEKHRALVMQKLKLRSALDLRLLAMELRVIERPPVPAHGG